jgi:hypothetical protein
MAVEIELGRVLGGRAVLYFEILFSCYLEEWKKRAHLIKNNLLRSSMHS